MDETVDIDRMGLRDMVKTLEGLQVDLKEW